MNAFMKYLFLSLMLVLAGYAGFLMWRWPTLVILVAAPIMYVALFCDKWQEDKVKKVGLMSAAAVLAALLMAAPMWICGWAACVLPWVGLALIGFLAVWYARQIASWKSGVALFLFCGLIFPVLSMGFNPFSEVGGRRGESGEPNYCYAWRGVTFLYDGDKMGLCDRYSIILSPEYQEIKILDSLKPYFMVKKDSLYGIFDIERREMVAEPQYVSVTPYKYRVPLALGNPQYGKIWALHRKGTTYEWDEYLKVYPFYIRSESDCAIISESPIWHELESEMPLDYNFEMPHAWLIDNLLGKMMHSLWDKDEAASYADHYWDWAAGLTAKIDTLHGMGLFEADSASCYDMAVAALCDFVMPSFGGTQAAMNCGSYVCSTAEMYRMMKMNADLASMFPDVDFRREWTLYNEYKQREEEFQALLDQEIGEAYSSKPMDDNEAAALSFMERTNSLKDVILAAHGKAIAREREDVTDSALFEYFRDMTPLLMHTVGHEDDYPSDSIGKYFFRWIAYRDSLASRLPARLAQSYRNQTVNIRSALIANAPKPVFLCEYSSEFEVCPESE